MPYELLTFRTLYDSPMIGVRDYVCRDTTCTRSAEEHSDVNAIVLMRHGAFTKHFGKQQVTADVNQAIFFPKTRSIRSAILSIMVTAARHLPSLRRS